MLQSRDKSPGSNGTPNVALALYQPDIPQNAGNLFRTAACFGIPVHLIEPCGFVMSHSRLKRAGMDYVDHLDLRRHADWQHYVDATKSHRQVLLTTKGAERLDRFEFRAGDILLLGQESAGVPENVHEAADARVILPMAPGLRSLNVAVSGAIAVFEALRQLQALPRSNKMPPSNQGGRVRDGD